MNANEGNKADGGDEPDGSEEANGEMVLLRRWEGTWGIVECSQ